jgi:hypothetical protein
MAGFYASVIKYRTKLFIRSVPSVLLSPYPKIPPKPPNKGLDFACERSVSVGVRRRAKSETKPPSCIGPASFGLAPVGGVGSSRAIRSEAKMTTRPKRKTTTSRKSGKGTNAKPRQTKLARLIGLLKRANGSDVATLSRELGWQQHTTRAALTGLRKTGFTIARVQPEGGRTATYRITAEPKDPAAR